MKKAWYIKHKTFLTWMLSYALVLVVPILIGTFAYHESIRVISEEVNKVHSTSMKQVKNIIDENLKEVVSIGREISQNDNVLSIVSRTEILAQKQNETKQLQKELNNINNSDSFVDQCFVYFVSSNVVISGSKIYNGEELKELGNESFGLSSAEFVQSIRGRNIRSFIIAKKVLESGLYINKVIYMHSILSEDNKTPLATVLVTVDGEKIKKIFKDLQWTTQGSVFVIDDKNEFIDSGIFVDLSSFVEYSAIRTTNEVSYKTIYKQKMAINHISSNINGWEYGSVIPMEIFLEKVDHIRSIIWIYLLVSMVVGGLIVYSLTKRNYSSLDKIIQTFRSKIEKAEGEAVNEFRFLENSLNTLLNEKENFEQKIKQQSEVQRNNFLIRLMKGRIWNFSNIQEESKTYGVEFKSNHFMVMIFSFEDFSQLNFTNGTNDHDEDMSIMYPVIRSFVEELLGQNYNVYVCEMDGTVACLINISENETSQHFREITDEITRFAHRIKDFFTENFELYLSAAISSVHTGYSEISQAYSEALEVTEYKILVGGTNTVLEYGAIRRDQRKDSLYFSNMQQERKFMNCIIAEDYKGAEQILNDMFNSDFAKNIPSLQVAKCRMFGLVNTMVNAMGEIKTSMSLEFFEELEPVNRLLNAKTITELQHQINYIFNKINEHAISKNKVYFVELMDAVVEYIKENYNNAELNVSGISEKFGINFSYLSRMFKKHTGVGVLDYIHKVRLDEAKELMKNTKLNIKDIAEKVGYYNTINMTRNFRKYEGVTPGKFRETN